MALPFEEEEEAEEGVEVDISPQHFFPTLFYDPTTGELMTDPFVDEARDSYEKSSLTDNSVTYYPNRSLKSIIQREVEF